MTPFTFSTQPPPKTAPNRPSHLPTIKMSSISEVLGFCVFFLFFWFIYLGFLFFLFHA